MKKSLYHEIYRWDKFVAVLVFHLAIVSQFMWPSDAMGAEKIKLEAEGSIFFPTYIAEGTVYTRGVANMPLARNSAEIAKCMAAMPAKFNDKGVTSSLNAVFFNLPIYVVDSRDPKTPKVKVVHPAGDYRIPNEGMNKILFADNIPIPEYAKSANPVDGGDHSMAIYDIGTGIIREYFYMMKQEDGSWMASWGGYYEGMFDLAKNNYACQHTAGSDFVVGMIGGPCQIGVEEARRGEIRHAVGLMIPSALAGVASWPAKGSDGKNEFKDPNVPALGQWFRLNPKLDIDSMNLKPMTKLIAIAVQKYGGIPTDTNGFCHAFQAEPGFVEMHKTGIDPWTEGGDLYSKYELGRGGNILNDFPWQLTEWAPVDWGKRK